MPGTTQTPQPVGMGTGLNVPGELRSKAAWPVSQGIVRGRPCCWYTSIDQAGGEGLLVWWLRESRVVVIGHQMRAMKGGLGFCFQ